jgi:hypothetical protein
LGLLAPGRVIGDIKFLPAAADGCDGTGTHAMTRKSRRLLYAFLALLPVQG